MLLKTDLLLQEQPARRGFLRTLIAAPAAVLATHKLILPAQTIVTPDDPLARLEHHLAGVAAAMRDLYPGVRVRRWGTALEPESHEYLRSAFAAGYGGKIALVALDASLSPPRGEP